MEKVLTSKSNKLVRIGLDGRTYIAAGAMKGNIAFPKSTTSLNSDYDLMSAVKIKFRINEESFESYHTFRGGKEFRPVLPRTLLAPGDVVAISIGGLSRQNFLDELPNLRFRNVSGVRWVSDVAVASIAKHDALRLWIRFRQSNRFASVKSFTLSGDLGRFPGKCNQHRGVYLQFSIYDYAHREVRLRLTYDGLTIPGLQIDRGAGFETVQLVSYDGYRLSFVYGFNSTVSTVYLRPPNPTAFLLSSLRKYSGNYLEFIGAKHPKAWILELVKMKRALDRTVFENGSKYDQGRIGSEIAHAIGVRRLGLHHLIMEEPSKGGRDLHTKDQKVSIQTRLLRDSRDIGLLATVQNELFKLRNKLMEDFKFNNAMRRGYAILSFRDEVGVLKSLILEVDKPAEGSAPSTPRLRGA